MFSPVLGVFLVTGADSPFILVFYLSATVHWELCRTMYVQYSSNSKILETPSDASIHPRHLDSRRRVLRL